MINKFIKLTITLFFTLTLSFSANAEIKVVASIKPIHSLASYLMDGVGKPDLIVDGYNTIADAMTTLLYLLAVYPEVQTKAQDEIDSIFEEKGSGKN